MSTLYMQKSVTDTICLSLIFQDGGELTVFDGGFESEGENLAAVLNRLGGRVKYWVLTHPHDDHMGAFCHVMEHHPEITVEAACYHFLPYELICRHSHSDPNSLAMIPRIAPLCEARGTRIITACAGDTLGVGGAALVCLRQPDPALTQDQINNSSTVWRIETNGKRILILGDLGRLAGEQLAQTLPAAELKSDYVQMAHHGQNGADKRLYELIDPDYCIWCTPTWVWDNMGEGGYDTGPFKTVITRGWMSELGIKRHYVDKDGPFAIEL
ncbi:MAG: MBL fold metallo-hydrolase [Oscillospiraceae bacterium]|nr:MBL fold metallo-hydrolase [Oscillospiraceae bacterium]